ncbi:MAG: hypothetical protein ACRD8O_09825 [Bryobacteraceae bacterium]
MTRLFKTLAPLILLFGSAAYAVPLLQLDPVGGSISGTAGSTIGWGFTITNLTDYAVVTSADFQPPTPLGTFTDFIAQFNFIVVGPPPESPVVSQVFDDVLKTGIGSFAINPGALPGQFANGLIVLTYDLYSRSPNDPNFNPSTDTISVGNLLNADASVTVAEIPEPATWLFAAGGLTALLLSRFRRRE